MTWPPVGTYIRDSQAAFDEAIRRGLMTDESAGKWMYMWSDASRDHFKHIDTRKYWKIDRFGRAECQHGLWLDSCDLCNQPAIALTKEPRPS